MHSETIDSADDSSRFNLCKASFHVSDASTLESVDALEGMRKQVDQLVLCPQVIRGKMLLFEFITFYLINLTVLSGTGRPLCD